eukprot:m.10468 g.10468  ORF g.10468 m.10468 type:complete len:122 (-) comp6612_c0_seq1:186-551(-)
MSLFEHYGTSSSSTTKTRKEKVSSVGRTFVGRTKGVQSWKDGFRSSSTTASPQLVLAQDLEVLREFDMEGKFGPCGGITRMERWERAKAFGLNPPQRIKDILVKNSHSNTNEYNKSVWDQK